MACKHSCCDGSLTLVADMVSGGWEGGRGRHGGTVEGKMERNMWEKISIAFVQHRCFEASAQDFFKILLLMCEGFKFKASGFALAACSISCDHRARLIIFFSLVKI